MLRIKKISEVIGKHAYTSDGDYFGQIEDVHLVDNRIQGWKIRLSSGFIGLLGGAKGAVVPQQFVKSIGDVFIVNRGSLPGREDAGQEPAAQIDLTSKDSLAGNTGSFSFS